jgi:8-oxo-dGTP pyrophosphatase MutT (NUDIX family)
MNLRTRNKMSSGRYIDPINKFFEDNGLDGNCRRKAGGAGGFSSLCHFVFYVMFGENVFFVVPAGSSPIFGHQTMLPSPNDAAFECLGDHKLRSPGAKKPSNLISANGVFVNMSITFVELTESDLVSSSSFLSKKVFSFVNPVTGKSRKEEDRTIPNFGVLEYNTLLSFFLSLSPSKSALGKGGRAVPVAVGGGGGRAAPVAVGGGGGRAAPVAVGGGGGPAASVSDRSRLIEVTEMDPYARNSFGFIFFKNPRGGALLVKTSLDQCWGLPGGIVNSREKPREALEREFEEEMKFKLPHLDGSDFGTDLNKPIMFEWAHRHCASGIYCGKSSVSFSEFQRRFIPNGEICEIGVFTPQQILDMALGRDPVNKLRDCASQSIITILLHLGLIV